MWGGAAGPQDSHSLQDLGQRSPRSSLLKQVPMSNFVSAVPAAAPSSVPSPCCSSSRFAAVTEGLKVYSLWFCFSAIAASKSARTEPGPNLIFPCHPTLPKPPLHGLPSFLHHFFFPLSGSHFCSRHCPCLRCTIISGIEHLSARFRLPSPSPRHLVMS